MNVLSDMSSKTGNQKIFNDSPMLNILTNELIFSDQVPLHTNTTKQKELMSTLYRLKQQQDALQAGSTDKAQGYTHNLLHMAIPLNDLQSVTFLLDNKIDINFPDANSNTPLILAVSHGLQDMTGLLLRRGASTDAVQSEG
jgi:ankyrin repeat protein